MNRCKKHRLRQQRCNLMEDEKGWNNDNWEKLLRTKSNENCDNNLWKGRNFKFYSIELLLCCKSLVIFFAQQSSWKNVKIRCIFVVIVMQNIKIVIKIRTTKSQTSFTNVLPKNWQLLFISSSSVTMMMHKATSSSYSNTVWFCCCFFFCRSP